MDSKSSEQTTAADIVTVATLRQLNDKDPIQNRIFLVKDKNLGVGKTGKSFITLLVGDATGQIDARVWDNAEEISELFQIGDLIMVKGIVQVYNQRKQIIIHKLEKVTDPKFNKDDFKIKEKEIDPHKFLANIHGFVQQIKNNHIKQLILETLNDDEIKQRLLKSPAAKTIHHAHKGGLLEHVVSICHIMNFMASHYSYLNKDLLIFGAIFHDLGKIYELDLNEQQQIYYTNPGQLLGHMLISCEIIEKKSQRILGFPEELRMILKHIVLSHHGRIEYGSPKLPMFPEALLVAMIDDLDSKMDTLFGFMNQERSTGAPWSRFHEGFERFFLLEDLKKKWSE